YFGISCSPDLTFRCWFKAVASRRRPDLLRDLTRAGRFSAQFPVALAGIIFASGLLRRWRNKALKGLTIWCAESIRQNAPGALFPEVPVNLINLKLTPILGMVLGVTLLGLSAAGAPAAYLSL